MLPFAPVPVTAKCRPLDALIGCGNVTVLLFSSPGTAMDAKTVPEAAVLSKTVNVASAVVFVFKLIEHKRALPV